MSDATPALRRICRANLTEPAGVPDKSADTGRLATITYGATTDQWSGLVPRIVGLRGSAARGVCDGAWGLELGSWTTIGHRRQRAVMAKLRADLRRRVLRCRRDRLRDHPAGRSLRHRFFSLRVRAGRG